VGCVGGAAGAAGVEGVPLLVVAPPAVLVEPVLVGVLVDVAEELPVFDGVA